MNVDTEDEYEIDANEELENHLAELARRKLRIFVEKAWPIVEPDVPFVSNWHIDAICEDLEAVSRGDITDLLINVPPGCMKSLLVSVLWPCWEWASIPSLRYLTAAYGGSLTIRDNVKVREIVSSPWYQKHYGVAFAGDQNAKEKFETTDKGWRIATSVGGRGTGEHPDRVIIDDPHTADQAQSKVEREGAVEWFKRTISSRGVARGRRVVVIMQRLHEEDLSGHILQRGGFEHIMFPMEFDPKRADRRDPRTEAGQLLWPAVFNKEAVRKLKIALGAYDAAGQLQQIPAPEGGGLFKRDWFPIVDVAPSGGIECRGWDTAATDGDGDYTVGVKIRGPIDGIYYVMHVARGQWGADAVDKVMKETASADGRSCRVREEKEPGSSGKAVISTRTRGFGGYDYSGVTIDSDKITRARPFRAQAEAGNVRLVRGEWNAAYLDELCIFPNGKHDDQVDGSSCAFNEIATGPRPVRQRKLGMG